MFRRWYPDRGRLDRHRRFRRPGKDALDIDAINLLGSGIDGGLTGIAISIIAFAALVLVFLLVVFVLLPVIGVAFEVALIVLFFTSGLFGRIVLRRPWVVEAKNLTEPGKSRRYAVKGWLRSRRAIAEIKSGLATGGLPAMVEGAVLLDSSTEGADL